MAMMKEIVIDIDDEDNASVTWHPKYCDEQAYHDVITYVCNDEKTGGCIGGWGVDLEHADEEMLLVTKLHQKKTDSVGQMLRHWVISFLPAEIVPVASYMNCSVGEALTELGYQLTRCYGNQYQMIFGAHWLQEAYPHLHIVMNTTSFADGHKFHCDRECYYQYIAFVKEVLRCWAIGLQVDRDNSALREQRKASQDA